MWNINNVVGFVRVAYYLRYIYGYNVQLQYLFPV